MDNKEKCCCSTLVNFTTCDEETTTASSDVEVINDSKTILPTDQILIIRKNCKESRVYEASLNDLDPRTALLILSKAVQAMSQTDPGDGFTLWNDDGFIRVASGVKNQGRMSAKTLLAALEELYQQLPTSNPNDGSPWNNAGFIVQGTNLKGKNNGSN